MYYRVDIYYLGESVLRTRGRIRTGTVIEHPDYGDEERECIGNDGATATANGEGHIKL